MSQRAIILSIVLFILLVAGMFAFTYFKQQQQLGDAIDTVVDDAVLYPDVQRITAKQFYADGIHTLVGEVELPTPCDLLSADVRVMESFPEQVAIDFTVLNTAEMCAEVITSQRFKVSASASSGASFSATFMGRPVELNLIPPEPGETPDDFELFIKG